MQINIERETLLKGIGHVLGVVNKRGTLPILSHCLLQTNGNGIFISATDLEISFRGFYPAEVTESGALTVQAGYFNNLIKDLPKGPLALVGTDKAAMQIQTGDSRYQLYGLAAEQFPPIPETLGENLVEVESRLLKEMILKTIFSVSGDDLQYNLSAIFCERVELDEGNWLRLVSTDGHRLTLVERTAPQLAGETAILIPGKGAREMARFLEGETVQIGISDKVLVLKDGDRELSIRLLDKKFPEYGRIIPESFKYSFTLNRQTLIDSLKRLAVLGSDRFKGMFFKLEPEQLQIIFNSPDAGEGLEVLPVVECTGELDELPVEVGFNARYIIEPLLAMAGEQVLLEVNGSDRPARVREPGDNGYFSIIMPMGL